MRDRLASGCFVPFNRLCWQGKINTQKMRSGVAGKKIKIVCRQVSKRRKRMELMNTNKGRKKPTIK